MSQFGPNSYLRRPTGLRYGYSPEDDPATGIGGSKITRAQLDAMGLNNPTRARAEAALRGSTGAGGNMVPARKPKSAPAKSGALTDEQRMAIGLDNPTLATMERAAMGGRVNASGAMTDSLTTGGMAGPQATPYVPYADRYGGPGVAPVTRQQPVTPSPTSPYTPMSLRQRGQSIQDTIYGTQRDISTARTQERVLEGMLTDSTMSPAEQMILRQRLAEARLGRVDALGEINAARGELDLVNRAQMPDARAMSASHVNAGRQSLMSQGAMTNDRERRIIENQLRMETNPQMRMQLEDRLSRLAASDAALSRMGQPVTSAEMGDRAASVGRSNEARRSVRDAAMSQLSKIDEYRQLQKQRQKEMMDYERSMNEAQVRSAAADSTLKNAYALSTVANANAEATTSTARAGLEAGTLNREQKANDLLAAGIDGGSIEAFTQRLQERMSALDSVFSNFVNGAVATTILGQQGVRQGINVLSTEIDRLSAVAKKYPQDAALAAKNLLAMMPEPGQNGKYGVAPGVAKTILRGGRIDGGDSDATLTANLLNNLRAKLETLSRGA